MLTNWNQTSHSCMLLLWWSLWGVCPLQSIRLQKKKHHQFECQLNEHKLDWNSKNRIILYRLLIWFAVDKFKYSVRKCDNNSRRRKKKEEETFNELVSLIIKWSLIGECSSTETKIDDRHWKVNLSNGILINLNPLYSFGAFEKNSHRIFHLAAQWTRYKFIRKWFLCQNKIKTL